MGESHVGRRLILVFAPSRGRRSEIVHEQAGGPGHRRVCTLCGATVEEDQPRCPVDGAPVVNLTVRVLATAAGAEPTDWTSGDSGRPDETAGHEGARDAPDEKGRSGGAGSR